MTSVHAFEQQLLAYVRANVPEAEQIEPRTDLLALGVLDSLMVADLFVFLETRLGVVLSASDVLYLELYLSGNAENVLYRFNFNGLTLRQDQLTVGMKTTKAKSTEDESNGICSGRMWLRRRSSRRSMPISAAAASIRRSMK